MKINCQSCLNGKCDECKTNDCLCREGHNKRELLQAFTDKMKECLPNYAEFKQLLRNDIDKERTIDSDESEFNRDVKGGFYAYEEKNSSQHFSKDFVSDILLPAHVYNGKESCGKWKITGCLQSDQHERHAAYINKGIMRCNNKGCKICASSYIKREAKSITDRLMTFCNLKRNRKIYLKKNRSRILHHNIISIPFEDYSLYTTKQGRKKLRERALKILKQFDIDGGVMIDHPYRFSKGLESARLSPHFHLIVTGWLDGQIVKQIYEKTGWIVRNVSTLESWKDCYSLSKYLLSHSAVFMKEEGKRSSEHGVRYFGECHNRKFKVSETLKHSITGYDQIDSIIYQRKELLKDKIFYPLQRVVYTHSIIQDEIKDVQETYYEDYLNGNIANLSKSLRQFIKPIKANIEDNPAIPQSDLPSMEFLQMRFEYGNTLSDIVQSVYLNVVFDRSLDCICPECSMKMVTLLPPDSGWSEKEQEKMADFIVELPEGKTVPINDVTKFTHIFVYDEYGKKKSKITHLGMPYFDTDGKLSYDSGIYQRPECLDSLNLKLYWSIIKNINSQKAKFTFRLQNRRSPTYEELQEALNPNQESKIRKTKNQSLLNF